MRLQLSKLFLGLTLAVCLATSAAQAALINLTPATGATNSNSGVKLSDLLSGQVMGIAVGDKEFTGFSYSVLGDMPAATDVNVLGFRDHNGNWGISLHGTFLDLPGGAASDALIRFTASVSAAGQRDGWLINDAHLFLGGTGVGANSFFGVDETFLGHPGAAMSASMSTIGAGNIDLQGWTDLDYPTASVVVTKDILALAGVGSTQPARTTVIDQSFSQVRIPEPATVALAMLGLLGLAVAKRR